METVFRTNGTTCWTECSRYCMLCREWSRTQKHLQGYVPYGHTCRVKVGRRCIRSDISCSGIHLHDTCVGRLIRKPGQPVKELTEILISLGRVSRVRLSWPDARHVDSLSG